MWDNRKIQDIRSSEVDGEQKPAWREYRASSREREGGLLPVAPPRPRIVPNRAQGDGGKGEPKEGAHEWRGWF